MDQASAGLLMIGIGCLAAVVVIGGLILMSRKDRYEDMRGTLYRHLKTGGHYYVETDEATIEKTGERAVVYTSVKDGRVWVRPFDEFNDGRFERVEG